MNGFQSNTILKADALIRDVNNGARERHYLDEMEREFISYLKLKAGDYILTDLENHRLNKIRGKL